MTVTVGATNQFIISTCDSASAGGTWDGSPTQDADNRKEGSYSISDVLKASGDNDWTFTPTSAVDMSGTYSTHLRIWLLLTQGSLINTMSSGGIQIGISDGTNTGYYYIGGRDNYFGGWKNFVVDVSRAVDSGTKPTSMNAITSIIIRINLTGTGKNVDNTWVDLLHLCDGLYAYGDDAGSYFDMEDIFSVEDTPVGGGFGIVTKVGGVYYVVGELVIGDSASTNGCKFNPQNQVIVFEDRYNGTYQNISTTLMGFNVVDNGTGTTEFILGSLSGTAGINGCVITVEDPTQGSRYYIDGRTDSDVDNFKLYGSSIQYATDIDFPDDATNVDIRNCNFIGCNPITIGTADITNCNFISAASDAITVSSGTFNLNNCSFISPTTAAIEVTAVVTIQLTNVIFIGTSGSGPYDIQNTTAGTVTIQNSGTSNAQYEQNTGGGDVVFQTTVSVSVHVQDESLADVAEAQVWINKTTPDQYFSHASNNVQGDTNWESATATATDIPASGWLWVYDVSEQTEHHYRYTSVVSNIFYLPTKIGPTACTNTGSETTTLYDSGASFLSANIKEGDTLRNETDGSWAIVLRVISNTQINHTPLRGGTDNHWDTSDNYSFHNLAVTYTSSDYATTPILNEQTDSNGDASATHNWQGDRNITIRVRKSSSGGTKYIPYSVGGVLDSSGYSTEVTLIEDTIAGS